jgi:hypothetical protein
MGENSAMASDDEDGDDDEGDDGEEGEANEEGGVNEGQGEDAMADATEQQTPDDRHDHDMEDADESVEIIQPSSIEEPTEDGRPAAADTEVINMQQQPSSSLNLGAPHLGVSHLFSPRQHEGSPLKNVVLLSPTEPKNMDFPSISTVQEVTSGGLEALSATEGTTRITESVQQRSETTAAGLSTVEMSAQTTTIAQEGSAGDATGDTGATPSVAKEVDRSKTFEVTHESGGNQQAKSSVQTSSFSQQTYHTSSTHSLLPSLREPPRGSTLAPPQPLVFDRPAVEEDGLDLLGGLERELDRQSRTSITPAEGAAGEQPSSAENSEAQE